MPAEPIPYAEIRPQRARPAPNPRPGPRPAVRRAPPSVAAALAAAPLIAGAPPLAPGVAAPVTGARLPAGQPMPPAELEAFVDAIVRDAMDREHIAGVTVGVVQNGAVVLQKGYGFADLQPRRAVDAQRTLFRIGSVSKTFTWVLLMRQVEAGRMRLDDPVARYLPERVRPLTDGFDRRIRLRNLMDHSAGYEDRALGQLMERDADRVRPLDLYLRQERPKRVREPGLVSSYSNYGVGLAGLATALAAKRPFERMAEEDIFLPLGMTRTSFREIRQDKRGLPGAMPQGLAADMSDAYRWTPLGFQKREFEYIGQLAPAGSASSTAADMNRYMLMLLGDGSWNGVTVFGPTAARAFRTPLRKKPVGVNGWAHGFATYDLPGGYRGYGHGGATLSFMSNMVVVPQLGLGVFISTNTESGQALSGRLPDRLVRRFYAGELTFPRPGSPELARNARAYTGQYLTTRRTYSGLEGFIGAISGGAGASVTPDGRLTIGTGQVATLVPEGPLADGRFIATDGDERLLATFDGGRVTGFTDGFGAQTLERVPWWRHPTLLAGLALMTGFAAVATLVGAVARNRRDTRENQGQSRAAVLQGIQGALWLVAMGVFGAWAAQSSDVAPIMYNWPGPLIVTASACALMAAALTLATLVALPAVWRGGRRVDSWSARRKLFFTLTVLIYASFSVLLGMNGALSPWSG